MPEHHRKADDSDLSDEVIVLNSLAKYVMSKVRS